MIEILPATSLVAELKLAVNDSGNERWSLTEMHRALSAALRAWWGRVSIPQTYDLPTGFTALTYVYTLPSWVTPPFTVEVGANETFPALSYSIEPGVGGYDLRMHVLPPVGAGRIVWNLRNDDLTYPYPTLASGITAADTSLTLTGSLALAPAGYVYCGAEFIRYSGVSLTGGNTVLQNLQRGVLSTAAIHATSAAVVPCAVLPRADLRGVLMDQAIVRLHEMYLGNASPKEREFHQQMVSYYGDKVDTFWRSYKEELRPGRMRLAYNWSIR